MRLIFPALALAASLAAPVRAADFRYFDDAALRAVQFVDGQEGWAVGDEGVVWHTIDGGKQWERQPTGVRASLRAVHFLNPFTGWVAGREELPQGGSSGVLLVTRDGGLKWRRIGINALPGLHGIRFFDDKNGLAFGDGSEAYPSGLFATADGGHGWKPVAGPRCASWLAADFQDLQTGALAGTWSRLAALRNGRLVGADVDTLGGRALNSLRLAGTAAIAVGQGGLVLVSSDSAGVRWGFADLQLPTEVLACLDFHGVACQGNHVWVVGRPGSLVLHSSDKGRSWEHFSTTQPLPLHAVHFIDAQHGWAVGELGLVLATADGGKTWTKQREGGQRAAVLFIHARPDHVPFGPVALLGGEEGYLTAALRVVAPDPASAKLGQGTEPQRLDMAMRQSGGTIGESLWQFPMAQHQGRCDRKTLIASWNRLHDDRAPEELLRQLVLAVRVWKPEVIVTDASDSPLNSLVNEAVCVAFAQAADPKAFPEQLGRLGLQAWAARKLYGQCPAEANSPVVFDLMEPRPYLRTAAREVAAAALGLFGETPPIVGNRAPFRLLASRIAGADKHHDLMEGISLGEGGTARRKRPALLEESPEIAKAARARRNLEVLATQPLGSLCQPDQLLAQIAPTLAKMPEDQAVAASLAVADQFAQAGQWTLAREAYLLMVHRYPLHPLTRNAYRWLVRYNSSSEARRRTEMGQFLLVTTTEPHTPSPALSQNVRTQSLTILNDSLKESRRWYQGALEIEPRLMAFGPSFATDPTVQFCLQAARRNLGEFPKAQEWYTRFLAGHADGPWHDAAAAEQWLINRQGACPKPLALCRQTAKRPYLDGNLNDECWQNLKPLRFRNAVGQTLPTHVSPDNEATAEYATQAWFAYDKEFLYLALRCQHPANHHVPPVANRQHDADLRDYDRVSVLLDLDRDYSTYFRLEIDQRGCIHEDCWGDRRWNPRWFVAVRSEPTYWQIEAAIPMVELTADAVTVGRAWACNVVRILPGQGVQAWALPADVRPRPEGMGLLLFTAETAKREAAGNASPKRR